MSDKIVMHGREIDSKQVAAWVAEAEAGYDVDELLQKRGRPRVGRGPTGLLQVRVPQSEMDALDRIAAQIKTTRSAVVREAIDAYVKTHGD